MIENYSFYIETDEGTMGFGYDDIVSMIHNGQLDLETEIIGYDNLTRHKINMKAKEVL